MFRPAEHPSPHLAVFDKLCVPLRSSSSRPAVLLLITTHAWHLLPNPPAVYDKLFVPLMRRLGRPITLLQRVGEWPGHAVLDMLGLASAAATFVNWCALQRVGECSCTA